MSWRYYNHAMIPDSAPHTMVDIDEIESGRIWKNGTSFPLLVRWTTEYDCGYETNWWYVIKDNEYDISSLKAKRRYEITKARKKFEVRVIDPKEYSQELYEVQVEAFGAYPAKYRPTVNHEEFIKECESWQGICFGAFLRADESQTNTELCGYSYLVIDGKCINFDVQKTRPKYERNGLNAALVDGILTYFADELGSGKYICDGARSISHETAFQDYLEKYFGFRKAYCKLNMVYHPMIRWSIPILYGLKDVLYKFDDHRFIHNINAVLTMENIVRSQL